MYEILKMIKGGGWITSFSYKLRNNGDFGKNNDVGFRLCVRRNI